MSMFEGYKCQLCNKVFVKTDDIVVCPDCGAPYHRQCYLDNGSCTYVGEHGEGFSWKGEKEGADESLETVRCSRCGTENPAAATVCSDCGSLLRAPGYGVNAGAQPEPVPQDFEQLENEEINGVKLGDIKRFLGNGWFFTLPAFYNIGKYGRKISLNIIAMFTHGLWFVAKKMYGLGILLLLILSGTYVFQVSISDLIKPLVEYVNENDSDSMLAFMYANPALTGAWMVCGFLQLGVYAFSGLLANRVYYNSCIKRIHRIQKKQLSEADYLKMLETKGGTALLGVVIAGIFFFGVEMLTVRYSDWFISAREMLISFFRLDTSLSGLL